MSVQEAWRFIQAVRKDPSLRAFVEALVDEPDLDALVQLGRAHRFTFTVEDLRVAHKYDWAARQVRRRSASPTDRAGSPDLASP